MACKAYDILLYGKWKHALNEIRENCPRLSAITLTDPLNDSEVTQDIYVDFLSSYGTQLVKAEVHRLNEENLGKIAVACQNLRCFQYENENRFGRIHLLGHRIKALVLHLKSVDSTEPVSSALSRCTSLEKLTDDFCSRHYQEHV